MKSVIYILIIICILVLLGTFCLKPVILFLAQGQLSKVFTGSAVSIGDCHISLQGIDLSNIRIKKVPVYDFRVGRLAIQSSPSAILKKNIPRLLISDADITVNWEGKDIQDFPSQLQFGGSPDVFALGVIELSRIKLSWDSKEASLKAVLSLVFSLKDKLLRSCDLKVDSLASSGFQLQDLSLQVSRDGPAGVFSLGQATYADVKLSEVKGRARLQDDSLVLDSLSAEILGGEAGGNVSLSLGGDMRYSASLQFIKLDLDTIVKDFKLEEKVQLQGKLAGSFNLEGTGLSIKALAADMSAGQDGGVMTIKDQGYLNNLARDANQSLDLIVDSFKNYRYNVGIVKLSLQDADLVFDISLEGETGKRDLVAVLHDFKLTKEE
jgi:hypothetical protein